MIELIKEIPGPTFLFYYILFAVFIVFFGKIYAVNDYTRNLEVPDPALLEPLDMALLTKGVDGAIKVTVFNLWKKQIIDFNQVPNKVKQMKLLSDVYGLNDIEKKVLKKARRRYLFTLDLKSKVKLIKLSSDVDGLSEIENRILERARSRPIVSDFFDRSFKYEIASILKPNIINLESLHLLPDAKVKARYSMTLSVVIILLLLTGGTKLMLGFTRGKPLFFLFFLLAIIPFLILTSKIFKVRYTALGKKFIAASFQRFKWLKKVTSEDLMADSNLLYGVAFFGIGSLMGKSFGFLDQYSKAGAGGCSVGGCSSFGGGGCGGGGGGCGGGCGGCGGCGG